MKRSAAKLFDGTGDAAFGDEVFRTVLASLKRFEHGPHEKGAKDFDADTGDYSSVWTVARDWTTGRRWSPILPTAKFRR